MYKRQDKGFSHRIVQRLRCPSFWPAIKKVYIKVRLSELNFFFFLVFPYFFLDKKVTKNQDGSKRHFPLCGNFSRRPVLRRSKFCTYLNAVFLMRALANIITALIFRFVAIVKVEAMFKSKNRRCGNSLNSKLIADLRNSVLYYRHCYMQWA